MMELEEEEVVVEAGRSRDETDKKKVHMYYLFVM